MDGGREEAMVASKQASKQARSESVGGMLESPTWAWCSSWLPLMDRIQAGMSLFVSGLYNTTDTVGSADARDSEPWVAMDEDSGSSVVSCESGREGIMTANGGDESSSFTLGKLTESCAQRIGLH
ncbi:hypothetical protein AXG93_1774s1160 [Marchantia polymorpha subsp. ruderalis]|uniref:Uncharacterized protein n=1 Tax=Marchantia polymorpha subsp. ruderalis TaxID=1480154 RepID=A0A176W494_MARPO|nr:hypothetical protein AXG93_1774s1160 [Marchantia polymorpha subsp. ruderalis]